MQYRDAVTELHANEHESVKTQRFGSIQEYVLYSMHMSDYDRAERLAVGKDVLDVGCNNGYGTAVLARRCKTIVGIDVSPAAVEEAKSKYGSRNVTFRHVDGGELPFKDGSFDLVTSFQVIEHLQDYKKYFDEIRRVLRPAGALLLTTPNAFIRLRASAKPWNPFHVHEFRADELFRLIRAHFPFGTVVGQFATEKMYAIEYKRCTDLRDAVAKAPRRSFRDVIKPLIPNSAMRFIRSKRQLMRSSKSQLLSQKEMAAYSVKHVFYREGDLDSCLTLVACCSDDRGVCAAAAAVYLQDEFGEQNRA